MKLLSLMHQKLTDTLSQYEKIILVGGGTGGHIQPIVSLVHSFDHDLDTYLWIGGVDSTEEKTARSENIEFQSIPTLKLATTRSWRILLYPFYLIGGFWKARNILKSLIEGGKQGTSGGLGRGTVGVRGRKMRGWAKRTSFSLPNSFGTFSIKSTENPVSEKNENHSICLFSKGGPGSVAIGLAAWSLRVPLYIHESDTVPGRSNRILGRFANKIFLGFASASKYFNEGKYEVVGQILDPVFEGKVQSTNHSVRIGWKTTKPHILVICGSQGSRVIFEEILKNYSGNNQYEWIISLGKLNSGMQAEFEKIPDCQALEWLSQIDIAHLIRDTDLAITRGSATTLAELTIERGRISQKQEVQGRKIFSKGFSGSGNDGEINFSNDEIRNFSGIPIKLIIIPLPHSANNHQYYNTIEYEKIGYILLEQNHLNQLTETIQHNA